MVAQYQTLVRFVTISLLINVCGPLVAEDKSDNQPAVGKMAKDFELEAVLGARAGQVKLSEVVKSGPVVLVVLRGFPGYQCPICSRQVGSLISRAKDFAAGDATVLLVYPGSGKDLDQRAREFLKDATLPAPFTLLLDPEYNFTNAYGLRWDAPRETAYPATFVIDSTSKIRYARISQTHGGRAEVADVIAALEEVK